MLTQAQMCPWQLCRWLRPAAGGLAGLVALLLAGNVAKAEVATTNLGADYVLQSWQVEDGLPQSSVEAIVQTPDSYLWLATYSGLARFDGVRFAQFDASNLPGFPGNRPERLFVDREGALWVITEQHEVARLKDGACRTFGTAQGVPSTGAQWVGEDGQGGLWLAGVKGGLWRRENGRFVPVPSPPAFAESPPRPMVTDGAGRAWFNHRSSLFGLQNGSVIPMPGPAAPRSAGVRRVCASRDGGLWAITPEGLRKQVEGKWLSERWPCPDFKSSIVHLREDLIGNLWVATFENGLFRFSPTNGWVHFNAESGLPTPNLCCLFCDREGSVWVGTDGGGLLKIKPRLWKMVGRREGLGVEGIQSLNQDREGRIWFAVGTTKPYWLDRGMVSVASPPPLSDVLDSVWAILPARDGSIWIGTYVGSLFHYHDGVLTPYTKTNGMLAGSVRALLEDRQGRIWMGGFDGLSRIDHEQVTHYSSREGLSSTRVWALAEGASGCLYIGTDGHGLNVLRDGRITCYTRQNGLPDDYVSSLWVDAEDALWIGTHGGGLSRFQAGRFFNYRVKGGLPARKVGTMLEDNAGRLWMATDLGIVCASRHELNEFAAGRDRDLSFVTFDHSDGLATVEVGGVQPSCVKAHDGSLWFCTAKGAAFVDPTQLRLNQIPPPVIIEEVRIDDQVVEEQRSEVRGQKSKNGQAPTHSPLTTRHLPLVTLQPHQRRLEFRFTGLSYAAPSRVRFRYRMDGLEPDWVDGGTTRSALYTRLPPGSYQFRVTACNSDGVWNETGTALAIVVQPAWWQTWWLRALALVTGAAAVFGFNEWRVLQLKRRRLQQEDFSRQLIASQEKERHRIATELHDSLGQNLLVIKNRAYLGLKAGETGPAMQTQLQEISEASAQAIAEVRSIARALRPYQLERLGLPLALKALTDQLAATTSLRVEADLAALDGGLSPEVAISLYRIVQESLNNVAKHAQASTVRLQARVVAAGLCLSIQDDGRGFDVAALRNQTQPQAAFGLLAMVERVRLLGGTLTIDSHPGRGTRLEMVIPSPKPTS